MDDRLTLATKLIENYRPKALELLITYLQDSKVRKEAEEYMWRQPMSPAKLDPVFERPLESPRNHPQHTESSPYQRPTRQSFPNTRHGLPTPSNSAASVKSHPSHTSSLAPGLERINLLSSGDDQPVIAKIAPVRHNLIGDAVVLGRGFEENIVDMEESVVVPFPSGGQRWERSNTPVRLTWIRRKETKSNVSMFHIVPAKWLESDVIMASDIDDEHQFPSGIMEARSRPAPYPPRGYVAMEELNPVDLPPAPMPPSHPYHETLDRFQPLRDAQTRHAAGPTGPATHPRPADHARPSQTTTPREAQGPSSGQIHLGGSWGKTPIKFSFDPDASGEAFYQAFYQWAVRRNRESELDAERHRIVLWLGANKNTPLDEAYDVCLEQGELEELWEGTVEWIQDNKNAKAPHLYVRVKDKG